MIVGATSSASSSSSSGKGEEGEATGGEGEAQHANTHSITAPSEEQGHNFTPLPEILFGQSFLELRHTPSSSSSFSSSDVDFCLRFNTTGALIMWAKRHVGSEPLEVIKVPEAREWTAANLAAGLKQVRYDWVFGTEYQGELVGLPTKGEEGSNPCDTLLDVKEDNSGGGKEGEGEGGGKGSSAAWVPADESVIDRGLLQSREQPILFYDDITLYEDELHDHGVVSLNVKVRVMPTCWFLLLRYFLRVDGVLLRVQDTRYFHKFGEGWVGKEVTHKDITFAQLREHGLPTDTAEYRDANKVAALRVGAEEAKPIYFRYVVEWSA